MCGIESEAEQEIGYEERRKCEIRVRIPGQGPERKFIRTKWENGNDDSREDSFR